MSAENKHQLPSSKSIDNGNGMDMYLKLQELPFHFEATNYCNRITKQLESVANLIALPDARM